MNLKKIALSAAAAVMFGSFALAQGPAPKPQDGNRPEPPRPEMNKSQPDNGDFDPEARPMPPRHGKGEFKPGDRPMPPMPPRENDEEFEPEDQPSEETPDVNEDNQPMPEDSNSADEE